MGGRKQRVKELKPGIYIVGEGITEQYYFSHIKRLFGFHCTIKPRFFGNTSIDAMRKRIEDLLRGDAFVICVFDVDIIVYNASERKKLEQLQNKYKKNQNVLFCKSLPSIEYWFLLHYEHTNRHFKDANTVEKALKRYIKGYEKTAQFLGKEKWVQDLCSEDKLNHAIERSKLFKSGQGSYTNLHEAFNVLSKDT